MSLSIVIPVLNEEAIVCRTLKAIAELRERGAEVIVVDGGSADQTVTIAKPFADRVVCAKRGRASQMNWGAEMSQGECLLFLHADSSLPPNADLSIARAFARSNRVWGRFDVRISPGSPLLSVVSWMINIRSRFSGIATGDQAIFVKRSAFRAVQGYPNIDLMEDIALSKKLKRLSRPICLREKVETSARRWRKHGVVSTILLMWRLRLAFFFGADPNELAIRYGYARSDS